MSYKYEDPVYKSGNKYQVGEETWVVTGVWSFADDDFGTNARTDKLVIQQAVNGSYVGLEKKITPQDFGRAIANGHF